MSTPAARPGRPTWVRLAWVLIPAAVFLAILTLAVMQQGGKPSPGDAAPGFDAPLLAADGSMSLEDFEGKPVVLNFWASWCEPCDDEAPLLKEAHERYGDSVAFLGVNAKDSLTDARDKYEEWAWGFPSVRDEGAIYSDYGLTGQPETFFIDEEGVIYQHVPGPLFEEDLFVLLEELTSGS